MPQCVSVCFVYLCCGYEEPRCAPCGSEEPLQHSHHGWGQGCDARRQQSSWEDEELLSCEWNTPTGRYKITQLCCTGVHTFDSLVILLMKPWSDCSRLVEKSAQGLWWLCLSVAESSQWWVEGLHRKGHHRCCKCRHRRIWPCECNLWKRCIFDAFYCKIYIFVVTDIHSCPVQQQSYWNWPWIDLNCRAPWWWLRPWSLTQRGDLVCGLCQILMERTSPKLWHS